MIKEIDENFGLHASRIAASTNGMRVYRTENLLYVDSGLSCDTFNIIHLTNGQALSKEELIQAIDHFRQKDFAYCIWVNKENLSNRTKKYLEELSQSPQNEEIGMVLDLASYQVLKQQEHTNIQIVETPKQLAAYAQVIAEHWSPPDQNVMQYFAQTSQHYLRGGNKHVRLLTYSVQGKAVSGVEMFPSNEELLGLYGFATLENFRGKGIGSSLLTFALNKAVEWGYQKVVLQATMDGIGIYHKYGFEDRTIYYEYA